MEKPHTHMLTHRILKWQLLDSFTLSRTHTHTYMHSFCCFFVFSLHKAKIVCVWENWHNDINIHRNRWNGNVLPAIVSVRAESSCDKFWVCVRFFAAATAAASFALRYSSSRTSHHITSHELNGIGMTSMSKTHIQTMFSWFLNKCWAFSTTLFSSRDSLWAWVWLNEVKKNCMGQPTQMDWLFSIKRKRDQDHSMDEQIEIYFGSLLDEI